MVWTGTSVVFFRKKMLCQRLWGRVSLEHYKNTVALEAFPCRSEFAQLLGHYKNTVALEAFPCRSEFAQLLGYRVTTQIVPPESLGYSENFRSPPPLAPNDKDCV